MGILRILTFSLVFLISSCKLGYFNENNEYVPKHPDFVLKNKAGMVFPLSLDTVNIYRLEKAYYMGKEEYALRSGWNNDSNNEINISYIKFYPKGRCCSFFVSRPVKLKQTSFLKTEDLNPDFWKKEKSYYFSKNGEKLQIESFIYGEGLGMYITDNYFLNEQGDTLIKTSNNHKNIYVKEIIPATLKKYPANW